MNTIRELLISLGLDVDQAKFVEAIGLEHLLEKASEMLVEALKEIPKVLAEVVKSTAEYGNEITDIAERTGLSTDAVQRFGFIAGVTGESLESVETSLGHLARSMSAARDGSEESIRAFARLGVHATDSNGRLRPLEQVFTELSAGFQRLPKGADRSAAAFAVLGRSGSKMLNVIGDGPEAIAKLKEEFEALGAGMDSDAIARADELNKGFNKLGMVFESLKRELAGPLIEALGPIVQSMLEWVKANRKLIGQRIAEVGRAIVSVTRALLRVMVGVGKAVLFVVDNLKFFALVLGGIALAAIVANLGAITALIGSFVVAGASAIGAGLAAAGAWIAAAAPVLLLAALFAALLLILDDVRGYLAGEDSLIGDLGPKWVKFLDSFLKPAAGEHWLLSTLKQFARLLTNFSEEWDKFVADWKYAMNQIWLGLPAPLRKLLSIDAGMLGFSGGAAGPDAAGGLAAAASSSVVGGDLHAEIHIHPPAGSSAEAIGNSAVDALEEFHARKTREAIAAVGG